jgi:hypothetical protein
LSLRNLDALEFRESPLKSHKRNYEPWDEKDEEIFWKICNDLRIPFAAIVQSTETYNNKAWSWFRRREEFGRIRGISLLLVKEVEEFPPGR